VNAVGKAAVDLKNTLIDLFSVSGHKFHAPKGVGALYIKKNLKFPAFFTGGGQENGRRAGTEAVHQIVALGKASEIVKDFSVVERVRALRDRLEDGILQTIPNASLNGTADRTKRLPNTSSISFENTNGEAILAKLNDLGVCVSTGSACSSASHTASAVLQALDVPYAKAMGAIRFSLGRYNNEAEVDFVLRHLPPIVRELNNLSD
jgi:cysteine desulfurase